MQLTIPTIGACLRLTEDWTFNAHREYRNATLSKYKDFNFSYEECFSYWEFKPDGKPSFQKLTFPAGTILRLDRIYIRKGNRDYDSLSFIVLDTTLEKKDVESKRSSARKQVRFWAKLDDCNTMKFKFWE